MPDRCRWVFQDLNNDSSVNLAYLGDDVVGVNVAAITDALTALSACRITQVSREFDLVGPDPGAGSSGDYPTVDDCVTFEFQTGSGGRWPLTFPGPDASIFLDDGRTVDPGVTEVADLISAVIAYLVTNAGETLVEFTRGWRW